MWRCNECGSTRVEFACPAFFRVNDLDKPVP